MRMKPRQISITNFSQPASALNQEINTKFIATPAHSCLTLLASPRSSFISNKIHPLVAHASDAPLVPLLLSSSFAFYIPSKPPADADVIQFTNTQSNKVDGRQHKQHKNTQKFTPNKGKHFSYFRCWAIWIVVTKAWYFATTLNHWTWIVSLSITTFFAAKVVSGGIASLFFWLIFVCGLAVAALSMVFIALPLLIKEVNMKRRAKERKAVQRVYWIWSACSIRQSE